MMAEDLGVEAKEAAVREVAKLLPLQSISSINADYISRQQANGARLSTMVVEQDVEGMMSISVDDKEIVNTYERLTALDGKQRFILAVAASHKEEVGSMNEVAYLRLWNEFETTETPIIRNCKNPHHNVIP